MSRCSNFHVIKREHIEMDNIIYLRLQLHDVVAMVGLSNLLGILTMRRLVLCTIKAKQS